MATHSNLPTTPAPAPSTAPARREPPANPDMSVEPYDSARYGPGSAGRFVVYVWGEYPAGSVLAGQTRRTWWAAFDTEEEALAVYPEAAPGWNPAPETDPGPVAPSWFDPTYAGEAWDSEDY